MEIAMSKPMSLLSAVKRIAEAGSLEWPHVQGYYRAMQEPSGEDDTSWLPKSTGRAVWKAHPHFIAPILIALAAGGPASRANTTIDWASKTSPNGRRLELEEQPAANIESPIFREFRRFLTIPDEANRLLSIEVHPDTRRIIFNIEQSEPLVYSIPFGSKAAEDPDRSPRRPGIHSRGVIEGSLILELAETIIWRTPDQSPYDINSLPDAEG